ncbi:hypothetical protein [Caballeronia sordidicola]|uniref:hypothetical protein n=1 Tax=Caballeronia sordidicola TaxID=196367 RepID=UPI0004D00986|nr:hypothetical protein [Caballeronia sordidicola]
MSGTPSLFDNNGVPIELTLISKRRPDGLKLTEEDLQRAVDASPSLIPYREFFPSARRLVSLGMEIPLSFPGEKSGWIDNLFLTDDGHFAVVEMKLWRNPEAVREVVGQIFQYGLTLGAMSLRDIENVVRKSSQASRQLAANQTLIEFAVEHLGVDDEHAYSNAVEKHLRSGEVLYLIAGDGIHVSVDAIADWINAGSGAPFHFGLLELDVYLTASKQKLYVPRLRVKTKEIGRHVIEVTVEAQPELAKVQIREETVQSTGGIREDRRVVTPEKPLLSIEALEGLIRSENMGSPEGVDVGLYLLHGLQDSGYDSRPMPTETSFGIRDASHSNKLVSLINLGPKYLHLREPFKKDDFHAMRAFRERANQLTEFFDPSALDDRSKFSRQPQYRDLAAIKERLLTFLKKERDMVVTQLQGRE